MKVIFTAFNRVGLPLFVKGEFDQNMVLTNAAC